jgi:dolichol-phosphate mannosyltransferase
MNIKSSESISIIIPIFNEEDIIHELVKRLLLVKSKFNDLNVQFIIVDDGSTDHSLQILFSYAKKYSFFKILSFSRNFGHQIAITAGIDYCSSDWVAIIDGDLQDPPELIFDMYLLAKQGFDVVYGRRKQRYGESLFKRCTAKLFYKTLNYLCDVSIPQDTGDFRLVSKRVIDVLKGLRERHRFVRGMIPWLGFSSVEFFYNRDPRFAGVTKYSMVKMIRFAMDAIFSFSSKPLTLATRLGSAIILLGSIWGIYALYLRLFTNTPVPGFTAILLAIVIFSGIQIFILGIIGEYVARIFEESKQRPLYIIQSAINIDSKNSVGDT